MINEALKLLGDYGWSAVILFVVGGILVYFIKTQGKVWRERDMMRITAIEMRRQSELVNHQFFANLEFRLNIEIPTLSLNVAQPIRQKLFRKLLEVTLVSLKEIVEDIVNTDMGSMTPSQWASFVNSELHKIDRNIETKAVKEGMPSVLIIKYLMWKTRSAELLSEYVNDLAISEVYVTNLARTNTLLYLLNLKLITIIGDAERSLVELNGELTGLTYNGDQIE